MLVLLALVRKGRAATTWFYAGDHRTAFDILAKSPNEIAWHVLAFSFGMSFGSASDARLDNDALSIESSLEDGEEFHFDVDSSDEENFW